MPSSKLIHERAVAVLQITPPSRLIVRRAEAARAPTVLCFSYGLAVAPTRSAADS